MLFAVIFIVVVLLLSLSVYLRGKYNQNYWTKRGVAFYEKNKSGGPFWQFIIENRPLFEIFSEIYKVHENEPAVGLGCFFDKALFVKDPINIYHITQADFNSFNRRGIPITDEDLLANNILLIHGPKWKMLRQKLTPLFTGAKLKNMYYIIDRSAQDFVEFLKQNPNRLKGSSQDIRDTMSYFSAAAISAAVFGIGTESTFDSKFRKMVTEVLKPSKALNFKYAIGAISADLYNIMRLKLFGSHEDFFIGAMKEVFRERKRDGVKGHDFTDMCMKLQEEGTIYDPDSGFSLELTDEVLAAQAFFFFLAGVEPTSASMFSTVMELGRNPVILKRVHEEVDTVFSKYNGQLTYDAIFEVEYLDRVLNESMRMHPTAGFLTRLCTKDTVLPNGNIPVEKGVKVIYSVYNLHFDPKYFPNPEVFDPDRFLRKEEISDMTYLPFGRGNRICIGARYARLQVMSGLMHFLRHYTVKTCVHKGGIAFENRPIQVRATNVDIEFIPRNI